MLYDSLKAEYRHKQMKLYRPCNPKMQQMETLMCLQWQQHSGELESISPLRENSPRIVSLLNTLQSLVGSVAIALQYWLARHCIIHEDEVVPWWCKVPGRVIRCFNSRVRILNIC